MISFISYATEDRSDALWIHDTFDKAGLKCYMYQEYVTSGGKFQDEILHALRNCLEVWVLFTRAGMRSRWVWAEMGAALALETRCIVPIVKTARDLKKLPLQIDTHTGVFLEELRENSDHYVKEVRRRIDGSLIE